MDVPQMRLRVGTIVALATAMTMYSVDALDEVAALIALLRDAQSRTVRAGEALADGDLLLAEQILEELVEDLDGVLGRVTRL